MRDEFSPEELMKLAEIVSRGTIKLPIELKKYIIEEGEELNVTFYCKVSDEYSKWIPGLLSYNKKYYKIKDLEILIKEFEKNIYKIFGYFRYNDQSQTFTLEKTVIERIIREEKSTGMQEQIKIDPAKPEEKESEKVKKGGVLSEIKKPDPVKPIRQETEIDMKD